MRATLTAIVLSVVLFVALMLSAAAAPIDCPPPQVATHFDGGDWSCVNGGDNVSGAEDPKNPNR
jgi:Spy/CpxP family protein refolding chaperone